MDRMSKGLFFDTYWGKVRFIGWLSFLLVLFHGSILVGGYPLEEDISEAAAAARAALGMSSVGNHYHRGDAGGRSRVVMNGGEGEGKDDEEEIEDIEATGGKESLPKLAAMNILLQKAAVAAARTAAEEELEMRREAAVEEAEAETEESGTKEEDGRERGRARSLWTNDFNKKASQLCRTSATLQCGKRILVLADDERNLSVDVKCDLRDKFLKCIEREKNNCLELAGSSILPELPTKEMVKVEQSKLWNVLWTGTGGCILSH